MRGEDRRTGSLFSYVDLEARVPAQHPLRAIRRIVNQALSGLSDEFRKLYSHTGRPGIPPEKLLRALLLQAFYSIRSERRLMQELEFNLLYRWFVGLGVDDAVWDATVFCKNRDRLLAGDVATHFLAKLLALPQVKRLLSTEHFSVDGTLIEAWASIKSFRPIDGDDGARPDDTPPTEPRPENASEGATRSATFTARAGRTRRIARRPTTTPGSIARVAARKPGSPTWATR